MQQKKTAIVKKTYTKSSNNKILGIVDHQTLNTILGVLAVTGVIGIGYKVFFAGNGKKQEEPNQQQQISPQPNQQLQQIQQPPQQIVPNQSPEMIRNYLAGGSKGRLMVQDNASADIANNVAMIANSGQQQVFSEQPPNSNPNVKTKEQVTKDRIPPHGDNYYNALSGFKSPFLLTTPKPAEVAAKN